MTLEQLLNLGIKKEAAQQILEIHKSSIKDKYVPMWRFKELNNKAKDLKTQINEKDNLIHKLKAEKAVNQKLEADLNKLDKLNKIILEEYKNKIVQLEKERSIELYFKEQQCKNMKTTKHILDLLLDL